MNNIIQRLRTTVPYYSFQRLGFGFDPTTEKVKPVHLIIADYSQNKELVIENSKFRIPNSVHSTPYKSTNYYQLSYVSKREYEEIKASAYGFTPDVKLVVNASGVGRWLQNDNSSIQNQMVSICYEVSLARLKLLDPKMQLDNPVFMKALTGLPTMLSNATSLVFLNFFEKFGTHAIIGENIGGVVQYDVIISKSHTRNLSDINISDKIGAVFKIIASVNEQTTSSKISKKLEQVGIFSVSAKLEGGSAPNHVLFESLDGNFLSNWSDKVNERPVELKRVSRLHPHYLLLEGDNTYRCNALNEATRRYLCGELTEPKPGSM